MRGSPCGSRPTTPTASRSASSTPTASTSTPTRSAGSSGCSYREDFRRAFAGDIGDIVFPPRSIEFYTAALERSVDAPLLRQRGLKVVLDYSYGAASIVMPSVLAKLGRRGAGGEPVREHRAVAARRSRRARSRGSPRWCERRGASSATCIAPDGERATIIDDEGQVVTSEQALLALVLLVAERVPGARIALPVSISP